MTEAELAARLARELGPLAVDAAWSVAATTGQAQGHYTDPISDAKEALGITDDLADVELTGVQTRELRDRALLGCLERLELHYATLVDTTTGTGDTSQVQKLSQVRAGIQGIRARLDARIGAAATGVVIRGRSRPDYTVGEGDEAEE
jgi:hypothetical protein